MSYETRTWAWKLTALRPAAKLTLLVLADVADEEGRCYCSQRRLMKLTNQAEGTVKRVLKELGDYGLIIKLSRFVSPDGVINHEGIGRQTADGFVLQVAVLPETLAAKVAVEEAAAKLKSAAKPTDSGEGSKMDPPILDPSEGVISTPGGDSIVAPLKEDSKQEETTPTPPKPEGHSSEIDLSEAKESFERFRQARGKHPIEDEVEVWAAWLKLAPDDREIRIQAVAVWLTAQNRRSATSTPLSARRFLGDGTPKKPGKWGGYWAQAKAPATTAVRALHERGSREARAITVLHRIAGSVPPLDVGGRISSSCRITPKLLALADAPHHRDWIPGHQGAWREFIDDTLPATVGRGKLAVILAPWEFPPRVDGTLSSTGPPRELLTESDEEFMADGF